MAESASHAIVAPLLVVGRYAVFDRIASGGMATVHVGRLVGSNHFIRTVAIKRLHPQFAHDHEFTSMLLDEARFVTRIQHPNVVPTLDVIAEGDELLLVMEYVRGVSLDRLLRASKEQQKRLPPSVVVAIVANLLNGLHAAHEASNERGQPLGLVHRDVSPHNVLVGLDGVSRVLDFGIAKAEGRASSTREGQLKGKIRYMPPEQLEGNVTRAVDVYAAGIVLFEALTAERMFGDAQEVEAVARILDHRLRLPSQLDPSLAPFDPIFRRATAALPSERFSTTKEMSDELERVLPSAPAREVSRWVGELVSDVLDEQAKLVARIERSTTPSKIPVALGSTRALPPTASSVPVLAEGATITSASAVSRELSVPLDRNRPKVVVGVLLLSLLSVIAYATLRPHGAAQPVATARTAEPLLAASATSSAIATPEPKTSADPAPPQPTHTPTTTAATPPVVAGVAAAPRPKTESAARSATARQGTTTKPSCDPPFTVDSEGHRHFILECVK